MRSFIIAFHLIALLFFTPAFAHTGEYLNEQEIERVREAQLIDQRTTVFLRLAERRLNVLLGISPPSKEKKEKKKDKDKENSDDYGPEPTGTRTELLQNYAKVMSELMDKLEDAYEKQKKDPQLPKAIDKLLAGAEKHITLLTQLQSKIGSETEENALEKALEIAKMAVDGARSFK